MLLNYCNMLFVWLFAPYFQLDVYEADLHSRDRATTEAKNRAKEYLARWVSLPVEHAGHTGKNEKSGGTTRSYFHTKLSVALYLESAILHGFLFLFNSLTNSNSFLLRCFCNGAGILVLQFVLYLNTARLILYLCFNLLVFFSCNFDRDSVNISIVELNSVSCHALVRFVFIQYS